MKVALFTGCILISGMRCNAGFDGTVAPTPIAPAPGAPLAPMTLDPPAGRARCSGSGATGPVAAALACYASRVKPALSALARGPDVDRYRFGTGDYLARVLTLKPEAGESPAEALPQLPRDLLAQTTVLGGVGAVTTDAAYTPVSIVLRDANMPVDGMMQLMFFVDAKTLETPFVYRVLAG
jgi:hypothetical protein